MRACWSIACLTEVYRAGLWPTSPLMALPNDGPVDLLELADDDAVADDLPEQLSAVGGAVADPEDEAVARLAEMVDAG